MNIKISWNSDYCLFQINPPAVFCLFRMQLLMLEMLIFVSFEASETFFANNEDILEKYQYYYQYVLVDEFQDTNDVEYKLIKLLSKSY